MRRRPAIGAAVLGACAGLLLAAGLSPADPVALTAGAVAADGHSPQTPAPGIGRAPSAWELLGFGANDSGQLGVSQGVATATSWRIYDEGSANAVPAPTAVQLPGVAGYPTGVAAGYEFSLVVTSSGQLYSFGWDEVGNLGRRPPHNQETILPQFGAIVPTPGLVKFPASAGQVTQVAAGGHYSAANGQRWDDFALAATSSGQLYGFGGNTLGQLGIGPVAQGGSCAGAVCVVSVPRAVHLTGQSGTIAQLAAGGLYSLVLTSSGQLYSFGNNASGSGDLGRGADPSGLSKLGGDPTPTLVSLPAQTGQLTEIAAGNSDSFALTSTGQLYAFGANWYPTPTVVSIPGLAGTIIKIVAGPSSYLVLTSTGQLVEFTLSAHDALATVVGQLPGEVGTITQLAAAGSDFYVVTSSGQLYGWGDETYGELGDATNLWPCGGPGEPSCTVTSPTLVTVPGKVELVAGGSSASWETLVGVKLTVGNAPEAR